MWYNNSVREIHIMTNNTAKDIRIKLTNIDKEINKLAKSLYGREDEAVDNRIKELHEEYRAGRAELKEVEPTAPEFEDAKAKLFANLKENRTYGTYKSVRERLKEFGFTNRTDSNQDERGFGIVWFQNPVTLQSAIVHHTYDCFVSNDFWYIEIEEFY